MASKDTAASVHGTHAAAASQSRQASLNIPQVGRPAIQPPTIVLVDGNRIVFDLIRREIGNTTTALYPPEITHNGTTEVAAPRFLWRRIDEDRIRIFTLGSARAAMADNACEVLASGQLTITLRSIVGPTLQADEGPWAYELFIAE